MNKQATIKVIVVDPRNVSVRCIQMPNDFDHMKREVIGCDLAEVIHLGAPDSGMPEVDAWIDEEGTLKDWDSVGFVELAGSLTLAGVVVFTGIVEGEDGAEMGDVPDYFDVAFVEQLCRWVPARDVKLPGATMTTVVGAKIVTEQISPDRDYSNQDGKWAEYERRVRALEAEGMTRSDAQGVVDVQIMQEGKPS